MKSPLNVDVCVIGGGPAGFAAAFRAVDYGKRVALVERNRLGGAGLFNGALASKTMWHLAQDFKRLNLHDRGYHTSRVELNFQEVQGVKRAALEERYQQLVDQVRYYEAQQPAGSFQMLEGTGRLCGGNVVRVSHPDGTETVLEAENIVLATGSRPRKLDTLPIDENLVMTSDGIEQLQELPESLVILGAGVIGCEYATIFSLFGKTKVHLIDKSDRILPFEDPDISEIVAHNLERNGVIVHRNASLERMQIEDGQVKFEICKNGGACETYFAEKALVSIGRVPNIEDLGCQEIGLNLTKRGHFVVDDDGRTNFSNIFAVGDLTADIMLVNVGETEGRNAIDRMYSETKCPVDYANISTIMFLDPEVAGVGMNERQAQQAGIPYRVACLDLQYIPRAIAMRAKSGFIKVLVTDDDEMRILGMRAIGPQASSSIQGMALLIKTGIGIAELAEMVHPHPSIIEGVQECARMLLGRSILKPECFGSGLRCVSVPALSTEVPA